MYAIEQLHNGQRVYWDGVEAHTSGRQKSRWTADFHSAVKFADRESAAKILVYICDGCGSVVEHAYMSASQ